MIEVAVISTQDSFSRSLRRSSLADTVRVSLSLRAVGELRTGNGLDAVIFHNPLPDELDSLREVVGRTPVVAAFSTAPPEHGTNSNWTSVPDDDPLVVLAAALAVSAGLDVTWPDFDPAVTPVAATSSDELTQREHDVLARAAGGSTNRAIAAGLGISENTVKYHLSGIYAKLGVSRRSEMVFEAIRRGLISV